MRKIKFDEETIEAIRRFIANRHTIQETCNHFTLKYDTLKRVMRENNIKPFYTCKRNRIANMPVPVEVVQHVCALFSATNTRLQDICKECKLEYYQLQHILNAHFTQEQQDRRKSKLYRVSKLGQNNPMKGRKGSSHHNYKGVVSDGNGYLQCLKPDWYTGRKGSDYVFVHHIVICEALGITEIPKGFVVHHIDGDKHNNDISNLALMLMSGHSKLHSVQKNLCKVQRLSDNGVGIKSETPNSSRHV